MFAPGRGFVDSGMESALSTDHAGKATIGVQHNSNGRGSATGSCWHTRARAALTGSSPGRVLVAPPSWQIAQAWFSEAALHAQLASLILVL